MAAAGVAMAHRSGSRTAQLRQLQLCVLLVGATLGAAAGAAAQQQQQQQEALMHTTRSLLRSGGGARALKVGGQLSG
jgi:hypothetical protein